MTIYYGDDDAGDGSITPWDHSVSLAAQIRRLRAVRGRAGAADDLLFHARVRRIPPAATWATPSLSFTTPEAPPATMLINEIHLDPDVKTEPVEFIELYNYGDQAIDLSGWLFSDGSRLYVSVRHARSRPRVRRRGREPGGTANEIRRDRAGPWVGGLDNDGEQITLRGRGRRQPRRSRLSAWISLADGRRSAPAIPFELIHPSLDNDLGGSWRSSRGSAASGGTLFNAGESWRYFKGTAEPVGRRRQRGGRLASRTALVAQARRRDRFRRSVRGHESGRHAGRLHDGLSAKDLQCPESGRDCRPVAGSAVRRRASTCGSTARMCCGTTVSGAELSNTATAIQFDRRRARFGRSIFRTRRAILSPARTSSPCNFSTRRSQRARDAWFDARLIARRRPGGGPTPGRVEFGLSRQTPRRRCGNWPTRPSSPRPART